MKILQKIIQTSYFVISPIMGFLLALKLEQDIYIYKAEIIAYIVSTALCIAKIEYSIRRSDNND